MIVVTFIVEDKLILSINSIFMLVHAYLILFFKQLQKTIGAISIV